MPFNQPERFQVLRNRLQRLNERIGGRLWFPHLPLAILQALGGFWLLQVALGREWKQVVDQFLRGGQGLHSAQLPPLLIGLGMLIMALGLLFRSRLAWAMALLLAAAGAVSVLFVHHPHAGLLLVYVLVMLALLLAAWRRFDRSSVAASSLFALTSVAMLLLYATFSTFYLGADLRTYP